MKKNLRIICTVFFVLVNYTVSAVPDIWPQGMDGSVGGDLRVEELRTEYLKDPLGIDVRSPRLSWKLYSSGRGVMQIGFRVQVVVDIEDFEDSEALVWDTGMIPSDQSIHQEYSGTPVESRRRYFWRVKVWASDDRVSEWSRPAFWEMGLLKDDDWVASWITTPVKDDPSGSAPARHFRRSFRLGPGIRLARIYATSRGVYELYLNGLRVGDRVLAPGFSSYKRRLLYQTYDVTDLLQAGENALGAIVGDGWYRGFLGFPGDRRVFGDRLGLLLQLEVVYEDGTRASVSSDQAWTTSTGPILSSDIYNGEVYDARKEMPGWSNPDFNDSLWRPIVLAEDNAAVLAADLVPPVRRITEIEPITFVNAPSGGVIVDMGRNLVGWVRFRVAGDEGVTVRLTHAEALDINGELYTDNLRTAAQTDTYTLKGGGEEWFEPHFTFHGFRYVLVEGYPGQLSLDDLTGVVVHSDLEQVGTFETSNSDINQLHQNILWSQRGNFLSIPADCPQRDERLGWTGDAQLFMPTASFNMNVAPFFRQWLRDLRADQYKNGSVPWVIPDVLTRRGPAATSDVPTAGVGGWSDAAVIIPWNLYLRYGDIRILEEQYQSMQAWLAYAVSEADDDLIWRPVFHFGDWAAEVDTPPDLIATAYLAHSANLMSQIASVAGFEDDAVTYADLFDRVKAAFQSEFIGLFGNLRYHTQTAYALALRFDLLTDDQRVRAVAGLINDIRAHDTHLTTGFVGTPALCPVLSGNGHADVAYDLLFQTSAPSWLFPVHAGATTMWEQWRGIENGIFSDGRMNSLNHYASGSVGEWLYGTVGGINPDAQAPGFKRTVIHPVPHPVFSYVRTLLETMYGTVSTEWRLKPQDMFDLEVNVPANASASVRLPRARAEEVLENGVPLQQAAGVVTVWERDRDVLVEIGSGSYHFSYRMLPEQQTEPTSSVNFEKLTLLFMVLLLLAVMGYQWRQRWF